MTADDQPSAAATAPRASAPASPAYKSPAVVIVFLLVTAAGLAADLMSKHYVFQGVLNDPATAERLRANRYGIEARLAAGAPPREVLQIVGHRDVMPGVQFTLSTNPGVVFGIDMPRPLVAAATLLAMALVLAVLAFSDRRAWSVHLAMAFIMAGALGNLYDRLYSCVRIPLEGIQPICYQVRDFIDLSQLHYRWIFNIADVLLVVGVGLLLLHRILHPAHRMNKA